MGCGEDISFSTWRPQTWKILASSAVVFVNLHDQPRDGHCTYLDSISGLIGLANTRIIKMSSAKQIACVAPHQVNLFICLDCSYDMLRLYYLSIYSITIRYTYLYIAMKLHFNHLQYCIKSNGYTLRTRPRWTGKCPLAVWRVWPNCPKHEDLRFERN